MILDKWVPGPSTQAGPALLRIRECPEKKVEMLSFTKVSWIYIKAMASQVWSFNLAPFLFAYVFVFQTLVRVSPMTVYWAPLNKGHTSPHLAECSGWPPSDSMAFPAGFGWGASTAAYQVEGRRSSFSFSRAGRKMTSGGLCMPRGEGEGQEAKGKEGRGSTSP